MEGGKQFLIFLALCALVGAKSYEQIRTDLDVSISVPSTHIGDTEIGASVMKIIDGHPMLNIVTVRKNRTQCMNSSDSECTSRIQEPVVDVLVTSRASNGGRSYYYALINESQRFLISVDSEVRLRPMAERGDMEENGTISITLDVMYDDINTRRLHLISGKTGPTTYILEAKFLTITNKTIDDDGEGNGQSPLGCAPFSVLLLLALLPGFLLK